MSLSKKPHIIVASPGRLQDHLEHTKGFHLGQLKYLVLDEADRLLDMDFGPKIEAILTALPQERHTFLFSATMTDKVKKLQRASMTKTPVKVEVSNKYETVQTLLQYYLFFPLKYKETYLVYLINEFPGQTTLIFTSTVVSTQKIALMLKHLGYSSIPIHGQMPQSHRLNSLAKFKAGQKSILVATDVVARGLDIPSVDLVINYDVPDNSKIYIHRVGRTARAGRSGKSITLVTQYDVELYQCIETLLDKQLDLYPLQKEQVMVLHERTVEAMRLATNEVRELDKAKKQAQKEYKQKNQKRGNLRK
ncbi:ribosomal RNA processing protein [Coelomomyces lativittatus]|nr:ribosomal RNA processing protein [Coelomomyces lativittatus]